MFVYQRVPEPSRIARKINPRFLVVLPPYEPPHGDSKDPVVLETKNSQSLWQADQYTEYTL